MCHRSKAGLTDCGSSVTSVEPGRCTFCCTARVVTVMKECRSQRLCCSRFYLDHFGFRNGSSLPSTDLNGNFKDEHDEKPLEISGYPDLTLKYRAQGMTWSHFNPLALLGRDSSSGCCVTTSVEIGRWNPFLVLRIISFVSSRPVKTYS